MNKQLEQKTAWCRKGTEKYQQINLKNSKQTKEKQNKQIKTNKQLFI